MARLFKVLARGAGRTSEASLKLPVALDGNSKKTKAPSSVASSETAQSAPGVGAAGELLLNRMLSRQRSSLSEPALLTVTEQEVASSPDGCDGSLGAIKTHGKSAKWEELRAGEPQSPSSDTSLVVTKAGDFPGFSSVLCVDSAWIGEAGSGSALGTPRFVPAGAWLKEKKPAEEANGNVKEVEAPLALQDDAPASPKASAVVADCSRDVSADVITVAPRVEHGVEAELTGKLARVRDWVNEIVEQEGPEGGWEVLEGGPEESVVIFEPVAADVAGSPTLGLLMSAEGTEKVMEDGKGRVGGELADVEAMACWARSIDRMAVGVNLTGYQLKMVPPLASFHHLKTLNLAHNRIARIHPGMLPKSLHRLDLSHNELTVVDGFRELTRLKVLDMSHNHITRVGHGLASCTSMRELYVSDNEITVVDGLHRLPKLTALDLSRNRLTSTKALGALAANSVSLRSLNLAGNPIHKNLGEDAFRRYVLGLLPHLASLNMIAIKRSTRDSDVSTGKSTKSGRELSTHKSPPSKRVSSSGVASAAANGVGRKVTRTVSSRVDRDTRGGSRSVRGSQPSDERPRQRVVAREALASAVGFSGV